MAKGHLFAPFEWVKNQVDNLKSDLSNKANSSDLAKYLYGTQIVMESSNDETQYLTIHQNNAANITNLTYRLSGHYGFCNSSLHGAFGLEGTINLSSDIAQNQGLISYTNKSILNLVLSKTNPSSTIMTKWARVIPVTFQNSQTLKYYTGCVYPATFAILTGDALPAGTYYFCSSFSW